MGEFFRFCVACLREMKRGGPVYWAGLALLGAGVVAGFFAYLEQLREGLIVTGMCDHVAWGAYIANFTFLVGVAAAAVMVIIPVYVFHHDPSKRIVLVAEVLAVAACFAALLFVIVDLGRPDRMLLMLPLLGSLNFPGSLLAWDVIVVPGYAAINLAIPGYVLYREYRQREAAPRVIGPAIGLAILWAIALHVVTAFLFVADVARPFWHSALLAPRFLASAFASGPALLLGILHLVDHRTSLSLAPEVRTLLTRIVTAALQVNLIMLGAEVFTELYRPTHHSLSARYLFLGLGEARALVPWFYTALSLELLAVAVLMLPPLARRTGPLLVACGMTVIGVWIEKGMGLVIPGFIPSPLGEIVEYVPKPVEVVLSLGIWCAGGLLFMLLLKPVVAVKSGALRQAQ
ncbi:MAG: polysulfide reductase NrfD [Myxococcales bacterium]|nr:polysulfide reductase NrfD [Myxococcales bacterium]